MHIVRCIDEKKAYCSPIFSSYVEHSWFWKQVQITKIIFASRTLCEYVWLIWFVCLFFEQCGGWWFFHLIQLCNSLVERTLIVCLQSSAVMVVEVKSQNENKERMFELRSYCMMHQWIKRMLFTYSLFRQLAIADFWSSQPQIAEIIFASRTFCEYIWIIWFVCLFLEQCRGWWLLHSIQ